MVLKGGQKMANYPEGIIHPPLTPRGASACRVLPPGEQPTDGVLQTNQPLCALLQIATAGPKETRGPANAIPPTKSRMRGRTAEARNRRQGSRRIVDVNGLAIGRAIFLRRIARSLVQSMTRDSLPSPTPPITTSFPHAKFMVNRRRSIKNLPCVCQHLHAPR